MHEKPTVARKRLLTVGFISVILLLSLMTAQVALAGPSVGPSSQSSVPGTLPPDPVGPPQDAPPSPPTPEPTATIEPGFIPGDPLAIASTALFNWVDSTTMNIDLFATGEGPKVVLKVPSKSMSVGGKPASGRITAKPVEVPAVTPDTFPDRPTLEFSGRTIEITIFGVTSDASAQDITSTVRFNPPLEVGFDITDAEWEGANGDITRFQVRFFSVQAGQWIGLTTTVDPFPPRRATGFTTHLTSFGLFIDSQATVAPDGGDISLSATLLALMGLLGLVLVASGAFYLRRGSRAVS